MYIKEMPDQEYLKSILDYNPETGDFTWKWRIELNFKQNRIWFGKKAGRKSKKAYQVVINGKNYYLHRIAWVYINGKIPQHMQIDHINGDPFDNRIANLRLATHGQNCSNTLGWKKRKHSLPKGVYLFKGKYRVRFQIDKKQICISGFLTSEAAQQVYLKEIVKYRNEFVRSA